MKNATKILENVVDFLLVALLWLTGSLVLVNGFSDEVSFNAGDVIILSLVVALYLRIMMLSLKLAEASKHATDRRDN